LKTVLHHKDTKVTKKYLKKKDDLDEEKKRERSGIASYVKPAGVNRMIRKEAEESGKDGKRFSL
jgi:hypothetical protein